MTTPVFELRDRLAKARTTAGYTQGELADLVHLTRATLNRYETGQRTAPEAVVKAIAEVTGVPLEWFYATDETQAAPQIPPMSATPPERIILEWQGEGYALADDSDK